MNSMIVITVIFLAVAPLAAFHKEIAEHLENRRARIKYGTEHNKRGF